MFGQKKEKSKCTGCEAHRLKSREYRRARLAEVVSAMDDKTFRKFVVAALLQVSTGVLFPLSNLAASLMPPLPDPSKSSEDEESDSEQCSTTSNSSEI